MEKKLAQNQQARWRALALGQRRHSRSPRCEHRTSQTYSQRCSSRSRSPGLCEDLGKQETLGVCGVTWEYYCSECDPPHDRILAQAEAAMGATSIVPPSTMVQSFYVGVSRYLRRRWFGDNEIDGHISRWSSMHILALYSCDVGLAEDKLIKTLKEHYNEHCVNIRGGGGGVSPKRPSFLYICTHRLAN